jgi:hypothetical protein
VSDTHKVYDHTHFYCIHHGFSRSNFLVTFSSVVELSLQSHRHAKDPAGYASRGIKLTVELKYICLCYFKCWKNAISTLLLFVVEICVAVVLQINGRPCGVLPSEENDTLFLGNISKSWKKEMVRGELFKSLAFLQVV